MVRRERFVEPVGAAVRVAVEVAGGTLPDKVRIGSASAKRVGAATWPEWGRVDPRRQFLIDGLVTGEYEVTVRLVRDGAETESVTKTVSVTSGSEAAVTIEIDPNGEGGDRQ